MLFFCFSYGEFALEEEDFKALEDRVFLRRLMQLLLIQNYGGVAEDRITAILMRIGP